MGDAYLNQLNAMYDSVEYKQLREAQNSGNDDRIRNAYANLEMRFDYSLLKKELGTVEHLIKHK